MADDASPDAFHDANQSTPATLTTATSTLSDCSTPSPLQNRQLFPAPNHTDPAVPQYLRRQPSSEGRESLNMNDVIEEEAENGDGDSVGDAMECAELDECLEETLRDRLQVLVKEEGPEVSDCENNGILLKQGLSPEVAMPSVPSDWTPPVAIAAKGEPAFEVADTPGKCTEYT